MFGKKAAIFFSSLASIPLLVFGLYAGIERSLSLGSVPTAWAEDEGSEGSESSEGGSSEDEDEEEAAKPYYETRYRAVVKTIVVTEPGYDVDTDGDIVVDALDPDPARHQKEYFTDTDGDSVPNVYDLYHDEDDFAYFESALDDDHNGIIDSLEQE